MTSIRVLVVDDSVVMRCAIASALKGPDMEVVATAANGRQALDKLREVTVDAVTLDVDMPELDGIGTVAEIRKRFPRLPIIMCSTRTERGSATTMAALAAGANDYVTKPAFAGSFQGNFATLQAELRGKIKALCRADVPPGAPRIAPVRPAKGNAIRGVDAIAIAVSTGGPAALGSLFKELPVLPVPILIAQHMPPMFTKLLAQQLRSLGTHDVVEATAGEPLRAERVYVAPGDFHMRVVKREHDIVIDLAQDPPQNSCRPAADPLFASVASVFGSRTLGVVLTGMGSDGVTGSQQIVANGGEVIVQDQQSSVIWGMPGAVVRAGYAAHQFPLSQMAEAMTQRAFRSTGRLPIIPMQRKNTP